MSDPESPAITDMAATLRHTVCPSCGYPLNGLPPEGTCPECGCSYDDREVVLYGWTGNPTYEARQLGVDGRTPFGIRALFICLAVIGLVAVAAVPYPRGLGPATAASLMLTVTVRAIRRRRAPFPAPTQVRLSASGYRKVDDLSGP